MSFDFPDIPLICCKEEILQRYSEPHRYFHTFDHVLNILSQIDDYYIKNPSFESVCMKVQMQHAAVFHDIVYDPKRNDNEEQSVKLMREIQDYYNYGKEVETIILNTREQFPNHNASQVFNYFDRKALFGTFPELFDYGNKIWKEYSFHSYQDFIKGHINVIDSFALAGNKTNLDIYKEYIRNRKIRLAIYPGSFNPLHKGHKYILNQANKLFDKVVLAVGMNPDKTDVKKEFTKESVDIIGAEYFETIKFSGMLSDLVSHYEYLGYDVTIVKGIRNGNDLDSENIQRRFLLDMNPELKYVYLPTSNELSHISSSAIRNLISFGKDVSNYV